MLRAGPISGILLAVGLLAGCASAKGEDDGSYRWVQSLDAPRCYHYVKPGGTPLMTAGACPMDPGEALSWMPVWINDALRTIKNTR